MLCKTRMASSRQAPLWQPNEAMHDGHRTDPPPLRRDQALFLDFDGTLVEIAPAPGLVRVPARLPRLLDKLADRLDGAIAIVSGRPLDELALLLAPFDGAMAGQHGLERRRSDGTRTHWRPLPELEQARRALAQWAGEQGGVILEDKGGCLALHYRQAPAAGARCRAFVRQLVLESGRAVEAVEGKMVIELRPRSAGKDRAIETFLAETPFYGRVPVFVGDDTTDEDGFAAINRRGGISVRVGDETTGARHRLPTVDAVLAWLARGLVQ